MTRMSDLEKKKPTVGRRQGIQIYTKKQKEKEEIKEFFQHSTSSVYEQ